MIRKLSVTSSRYVRQFRGTLSRRMVGIAILKSFDGAQHVLSALCLCSGVIRLCDARAQGGVRRGEGGPGFWQKNAGDPAGANPRMVRSLYLNGTIWGVSFALHEHAVIDKRTSRTMNPNLPSIEAILVEECDIHVNALGIKGVGETGITSKACAIANGSGKRPACASAACRSR
jgi:hypothetical protein